MRLCLQIEHLPKQKLPLNYQYLISSWIYKTLHNSNPEFASWLHDKGYTQEGRNYKHFCFSTLRPQRYKIYEKAEEFELVEGATELVLSFNIDEAGKYMVEGVFKDNILQLETENYKMLGKVSNIYKIHEPEIGEVVNYRTSTPICISKGRGGDKPAEYLSPDHADYAHHFAMNLVNKANASNDENTFSVDQVKFELTSKEPASKLWTIKDIMVRGFLYDFKLTAPPELQKIGYYAGFGTQNSSLGMGMCEVKRGTE